MGRPGVAGDDDIGACQRLGQPRRSDRPKRIGGPFSEEATIAQTLRSSLLPVTTTS